MTVSSETILHITGYSLAGLGVVAAVWAVALRDVRRSRRGARCPKCWYDMTAAVAGHAKLVCPECGHKASAVGALMKRRRHWRAAMVGLLVMVVGYGMWTTPRVQRSGWPGAVPTTAIIAALPWLDPVKPPRLAWMTGAWEKDSFSGRLADELVSRRIANRELWDWQTRLLVRRCAAGDVRRPACSLAWEEYYQPILKEVERFIALKAGGEPIEAWFHTRVAGLTQVRLLARESWPAGLPIYARITVYQYPTFRSAPRTLGPVQEWELRPVTTGLRRIDRKKLPAGREGCVIRADDPWSDDLIDIGKVEGRAGSLEFEQRIEQREPEQGAATVVRTGRVTAPVRFISERGKTAEDIARTIVRPVASDAIAAELSTKLMVSWFTATPRGVSMILDARAVTDELLREDVTLALRVELLLNGEPVARRSVWWRAITFPQDGNILWPFCCGNGVEFDFIAWPEDPEGTEARWSLRLTGDPVVALRDFDAKRYWDGQVTVPINVAPKDGSPGR